MCVCSRISHSHLFCCSSSGLDGLRISGLTFAHSLFLTGTHAYTNIIITLLEKKRTVGVCTSPQWMQSRMKQGKNQERRGMSLMIISQDHAFVGSTLLPSFSKAVVLLWSPVHRYAWKMHGMTEMKIIIIIVMVMIIREGNDGEEQIKSRLSDRTSHWSRDRKS